MKTIQPWSRIYIIFVNAKENHDQISVFTILAEKNHSDKGQYNMKATSEGFQQVHLNLIGRYAIRF